MTYESKKKKYHRHTAKQIEELETFFKECQHPDEKERYDLSRKLGLEMKQVKFWFQNRRTQMKTQSNIDENNILKQQNEELRTENIGMMEAMSNSICSNCGGSVISRQILMEGYQIRIENARLKNELNQVYANSNSGFYFSY